MWPHIVLLSHIDAGVSEQELYDRKMPPRSRPVKRSAALLQGWTEAAEKGGGGAGQDERTENQVNTLAWVERDA